MKIVVKPTRKVITTYYETLEKYREQGVFNEMAVRSAYQKRIQQLIKE